LLLNPEIEALNPKTGDRRPEINGRNPMNASQTHKALRLLTAAGKNRMLCSAPLCPLINAKGVNTFQEKM